FDHPPHYLFYPLSLHDALPISLSRESSSADSIRLHSGICAFRRTTALSSSSHGRRSKPLRTVCARSTMPARTPIRLPTTPDLMRSEEHTSELQSQSNLVCRLLL